MRVDKPLAKNTFKLWVPSSQKIKDPQVWQTFSTASILIEWSQWPVSHWRKLCTVTSKMCVHYGNIHTWTYYIKFSESLFLPLILARRHTRIISSVLISWMSSNKSKNNGRPFFCPCTRKKTYNITWDNQFFLAWTCNPEGDLDEFDMHLVWKKRRKYSR